MDRWIRHLDARGVLLAAEEARRKELSAQAEMLALAAHWCDLHGAITPDPEGRALPGTEQLVPLGGEGTPAVEEFAAAEFAAMTSTHPMAARHLMADALDLRHRLPTVWRALHDLRVPVWVARKIATTTRQLSRPAAIHVDAALEPALGALPPGRLLAVVEARVIEADRAAAEERRRAAESRRHVSLRTDQHGLATLVAQGRTADLVALDVTLDALADALARAETADDRPTRDALRADALGVLADPTTAAALLAGSEPGDSPTRPRARLVIHLHGSAQGGPVARVEAGGASRPVLRQQVAEWLGHHHVTVLPVLDPTDTPPVDAYEFPARLAAAADTLAPAGAWPHSPTVTGAGRDNDHVVPYVPPDAGGPPGQTGLHNLARLTRHQHRIKTHGRWRLFPLGPGRYLWRTPHGFAFVVDKSGTRRCPRFEEGDHTGVYDLRELAEASPSGG